MVRSATAWYVFDRIRDRAKDRAKDRQRQAHRLGPCMRPCFLIALSFSLEQRCSLESSTIYLITPKMAQKNRTEQKSRANGRRKQLHSRTNKNKPNMQVDKEYWMKKTQGFAI